MGKEDFIFLFHNSVYFGNRFSEENIGVRNFFAVRIALFTTWSSDVFLFEDSLTPTKEGEDILRRYLHARWRSATNSEEHDELPRLKWNQGSCLRCGRRGHPISFRSRTYGPLCAKGCAQFQGTASGVHLPGRRDDRHERKPPRSSECHFIFFETLSETLAEGHHCYLL